MSIVFLFTAYPRWSETFLRQDLKFLQRTGLPIEGVALYPGDCQRQDDWPEVTVLANSLPNSAEGLPQSKSDKPSRTNLLKDHLPRNLYTALSLYSHRYLVKALTDYAVRHQVTHIHAEFADLAALVAAKVAHKLGITYSVGIHAFDIHASKFDLLPLFTDAHFITVCNQAAADACVKQFPQTADKLHLLYHGVNLEKWPYHEIEWDTRNPRLSILFVGRLVPKKGIDILLRAVALLQAQDVKACLTIVGDGPLESSLKALAEELNIQHCINWTGVLKPDQIRKEMCSHTCLCAPSVVTPEGDRDGIPNVILEAMATGLPVVASLVGSISEVITPKTGFPVDPLTPQSLAQALKSINIIPVEAARRLIEERFDAAKLAVQRAALFPLASISETR